MNISKEPKTQHQNSFMPLSGPGANLDPGSFDGKLFHSVAPSYRKKVFVQIQVSARYRLGHERVLLWGLGLFRDVHCEYSVLVDVQESTQVFEH